MQSPKLITNGEIINADSRQKADLLIENGVITKIGTGLTVAEGTEVINARGKYIFPGFIDPHVHIHLPLWALALRIPMIPQVELLSSAARPL